MRKRTLLFTLGAILSAAIFGSAQGPTDQTVFTVDTANRVHVTTYSDQVSHTRTPAGPEVTMTGNVAIEVNGVTVLADRAVATDNGQEYRLEGNVRLRVPDAQ